MSAGKGRAAPLSREDRRAAIVTATAPLVREHGRAVTTRQIAAAAGIAEGTIFGVFADKQELVDAVVASEFDEGPMLSQLRAIELHLPLDVRITSAAEIMHRRIRGLGQLMYALSTTSTREHLHPLGRPTGRRRDMSRLRAELTRLLQPDREELSIDLDKAVSLVAAMAFAGARAPADDAQLTPAELTDALVHGILRRGRPTRRG